MPFCFSRLPAGPGNARPESVQQRSGGQAPRPDRSRTATRRRSPKRGRRPLGIFAALWRVRLKPAVSLHPGGGPHRRVRRRMCGGLSHRDCILRAPHRSLLWRKERSSFTLHEPRPEITKMSWFQFSLATAVIHELDAFFDSCLPPPRCWRAAAGTRDKLAVFLKILPVTAFSCDKCGGEVTPRYKVGKG